jgi:hypothetical protein
MVDPVPRGIRSEGEVMNRIFVDFVIELEENTEGGVCEDGVRWFGEDVIV